MISTASATSGGAMTFLKAYQRQLVGFNIAMAQNQGAFGPIPNVDAPVSRGYNMCLWYAFSNAIHEKDHKDWMSISKVTTLTPSDDSPWGGGKKITEVVRLHSLLQIAAKTKSLALAPLNKFLKSKEYFIQKNVGKKPIKGLYTDTELSYVLTEHENRIKAVSLGYQEILSNKTWPKMLSGDMPAMIRKLTAPVSKQTQSIETAKDNRIKPLLVTSGTGKRRMTKVAKGENLPAKLLEIDGGTSLRTIGNVLWSPRYTGRTLKQFTEECLAQARSDYLKSRNGPCDRVDHAISNSEELSPELREFVSTGCKAAVNEAATVYLECVEAHDGDLSWERMFPKPE